jgi:hypothetical protein
METTLFPSLKNKRYYAPLWMRILILPFLRTHLAYDDCGASRIVCHAKKFRGVTYIIKITAA